MFQRGAARRSAAAQCAIRSKGGRLVGTAEASYIPDEIAAASNASPAKNCPGQVQKRTGFPDLLDDLVGAGEQAGIVRRLDHYHLADRAS